MLPRLESDLVDAVEATIDGSLDRLKLAWKSDAAVCVVMAAGGYPGPYDTGPADCGVETGGQLG